jgi:hypothetical protein
MSDDENYPRITITLPPDLAEWVKAKKQELESKDRRMKTSVSAIIADAIADMKTRDETTAQRGQAMPDYTLNDDPIKPPGNSAKIVVPSSGTSGGGYLTRRQANSRQAGKAK